MPIVDGAATPSMILGSSRRLPRRLSRQEDPHDVYHAVPYSMFTGDHYNDERPVTPTISRADAAVSEAISRANAASFWYILNPLNHGHLLSPFV